ncbi:DNA methyltransferase [Brevundimonas sp. DC300-4]|uniref:DNA methyltransferase n=1 Tax=Brevundimonas sp. DC300-4 TaxID=2804594 RepID=UPI003CF6DAB7
MVRTYSNPGDVVLDNTMGSGTTGCAAVAAGRKFIGIERDPQFFQIAKERIEAVSDVANDNAGTSADAAAVPMQFEAANDAAPRHDVIRYGTVCSGVEGVSLAWEPLGGFEPAFFSEIETFPSAVLKHHWPDVPTRRRARVNGSALTFG